MLMCNECYALYKNTVAFSDTCLLHDCYGNLVDIDSEIVSHIVLLNTAFKDNNIPLRTVYSCAGHVYSDVFIYPYLIIGIPNSVTRYVPYKKAIQNVLDEVNGPLSATEMTTLKFSVNISHLDCTVLGQESKKQISIDSERIDSVLEGTIPPRALQILTELQHQFKMILNKLLLIDWANI